MQEIQYYLTIFVAFLFSLYWYSNTYYGFLENPGSKKQLVLLLIPGLTLIAVIALKIISIYNNFAIILVVLFIISLLPNLWFRLNLKRKMIRGDTICGSKVVVLNFDWANALTDTITGEIYVTKSFLEILSEEEKCEVIAHEKGHIKNKFTASVAAYSQGFLSISRIGFLLSLLVSTLFEPAIGLLKAYIGLYFIFHITTIILTLWFWLGEHEADLNSERKMLFVSALIKMNLYNVLIRYVQPKDFSKLIVPEYTPKKITLKDVIKEILFIPKVTIGLPISHPPTAFRIFLLSKY